MKHLKKFLCGVVFASFCFTATADIFFDNGALYNNNQLGIVNGLEIGNEVMLGSGLYLTNFMFEYYSPASALNSLLGIDVRFYLNDGTLTNGYYSPGTQIYDSGWYFNTLGDIPGGTNDWNYATSDLYTASGSGFSALNTGLAGNVLPGIFTWTVTFTNVGTNDLQLLLANNSVATNFGTYWQRDNSGNWSLLTNSVEANFVSQFAGTVPEPTTFGLAAVGGALLLAINKLRRKR